MSRKPRTAVASLRDIPNIGRRCAGDLNRIGITRPEQPIGKDGIALNRKFCRVDAVVRHDPCLADGFLAAVDYMNGAPKRPWWRYAAPRKRLMK